METVKKGLTLRAYLIGILVVAGLTILIHLLGGFTQQFPETTANSIIFGIFVTFLFSLFAHKINLTRQEYTAIYSMILVSTVFAATWTFTMYGQVIQTMGNPFWQGLLERVDMPRIFVPTDPDLIIPAFTGGAQVPWGAWLIPMFYWISLSLTICFSGLFLSCIMRRQYVEVETLPFPIATPIISLTEKKSFWHLPNRRYLMIGMLICFLWPYNLAALLNAIHPPLNIQLQGTVDLGPYLWAYLPMAVLTLSWSNLAVLAFALLVPTDILLTTVLLHFIFLWIIPPIEVAMGTLVAPPEYASAGGLNPFARLADSAYKGPIHFLDILKWGGMLGLGIIPLFFQWRHLWGSLKAIIHPNPEVEDDEPLLYRWAWIGFGLTTLFAIILMYIAGTPLLVGVVFMILFSLLNLGFTRLRGESGGWAGNADEMISPIQATVYQVGHFEENPSSAYSALLLTGTFTWWGHVIALPPPVTSMEAFRIGSVTKTKSKDLFVSISIAIIISILIGFPFALWGIYRYGIDGAWLFSRIGGGFKGDMGFSQNLKLDFFTAGVPINWTYPPDWLQAMFGVVLVGIFTFLRTRYIGFPLNPIGIPLAGFVLSFAYILLWLIALIIKYVTLRVGGTKLYQERLIPIVVGILTMWATLLFIEGIITMVRVM
ncbi:MAG: hypothetical protein PVH12_00055 [Candidatus Bathyarchaeota archaeon]